MPTSRDRITLHSAPSQTARLPPSDLRHSEFHDLNQFRHSALLPCYVCRRQPALRSPALPTARRRGTRALATHLDVVKFPERPRRLQLRRAGRRHVHRPRGQGGDCRSRTTRARRSSWKICERGDFFGELAFLDGGARSATVLVTEDLEALLMDRGDLEIFLKRHPHAAVDLLTALGRRLRKTSEILRHTATRNVNEETEDKRTVVQKPPTGSRSSAAASRFCCCTPVLFAVWIGWNTCTCPRTCGSTRTRSIS